MRIINVEEIPYQDCDRSVRRDLDACNCLKFHSAYGWHSMTPPILDHNLIYIGEIEEPEYVPYTEVSQVDRDSWYMHKEKKCLCKILHIDLFKQEIALFEYERVLLEDFFNCFTFENGTPCGIKLEAK